MAGGTGRIDARAPSGRGETAAAGTGAGHLAVDPLTGLATRQTLVQHLRSLLAGSQQAPPAAFLVAINLDRFRAINALHGNPAGDQALCLTAERLRSGVRDGDLAARLGADEFAVITASPTLAVDEAEAMASRLVQLVQQPLTVGDAIIRLHARAAVIPLGPPRQTADDTLRDLDAALRQAKQLGPGTVAVPEPSLLLAAMRRYTLIEQLRQAIEENQFVLHYQPIVRLSDRRMVGAEALLRWNHPSDGLVASAAFLPALEDSGLIAELGLWVVREAVREIENWQVLYGREIVDWVAVNLSSRQLDDPARLLAAFRAIQDSGFSLRRLRVEVPAGICVRDTALLAELRELEIGIDADDFGTGGGSLALPWELPLDMIKLDGQLVAGIGRDEDDRLLRGLLDIARIHGAPIAAGGIETEAQHEFLQRNGCGFGQGYLFSEPMDGALLGAYALTHAIEPRHPAPPRLVG